MQGGNFGSISHTPDFKKNAAGFEICPECTCGQFTSDFDGPFRNQTIRAIGAYQFSPQLVRKTNKEPTRTRALLL